MASILKRTVLRPLPYLLTDTGGTYITKLFSGKLKNEISGAITDKFLELLLKGMDLAFCLSSGYRKNIRDFKGRYLFVTADNLVSASATFRDGNMHVSEKAIDDWDSMVTFKDTGALRGFLFSEDQDILNSILKNDVEVDGNLNYIYKFGFMAKDLARRLGI